MSLPPTNPNWPDADSRDASLQAPRTHPWRRFFARHIDIILIAVAVTAFGGLVFEPRGEVDQLVSSQIWGPMIYLLLLLPVETVLVSTLGTTPGKWLYAIRLKAREGRSLTLCEAAARTFTVCWKGMGLNLPIVSLICMAIAYNTLTQDGRTSWDRQTDVTNSALQPWRVAAIAATWAVILYFLYIEIFG